MGSRSLDQGVSDESVCGGATGAIGRQLVPRLVAGGHEVHGMTRSESKQAMLHELGAVPAVADALDPEQVAEAVALARPDVIVHQLTAIGGLDTRHFDRDFALTNRLRTRVRTICFGRASGRGAEVRGAELRPAARTCAPAGRSRARRTRSTRRPRARCARPLAAIRHLEEAVLGARWTEGIVLRYGAFYGPGTSMAPGERAVRADPQAEVPAGRRRRRRVVVYPRRRRRGGDGRGDRARQPRCVQRGRR